MQLYFIRHAQSENNLLYAQTGSVEGRSVDPDLTPVGRQQAEILAQFLAQPGQPPSNPAYDPQNVGGFALTHLYCSLMVRAVATGTYLARALDLPLVAWPDVHELGGIHDKDVETGGRKGLPGNNRAFFQTHYPDLVLPQELGDEGWWNRPFEDYEQRPRRAQRFVAELQARHGESDDRVAVVSHGGFYNYVLRALLHLPDGEDAWFSMNNAAITRIAVNEDVHVHYTNRLDYMPRDLIT